MTIAFVPVATEHCGVAPHRYNLGYGVEVVKVTQVLSLDRLADSRRRNRAMAAWTDLQTLRSVAASIADGIDQASIAHALGISQPAVSKLARRARASDGLGERTPREVILERAVGMITDSEMLRQLAQFTYMPGRFADAGAAEPESYMPGLRDQLEKAAGEGLLTRDEFDQLTGNPGL